MIQTVSIDNLNTKTAQEVFDYISIHLLSQNRKAMDDFGACEYRLPSGLKCAAGCLIPEEKYDPSFEGKTWRVLVRMQGFYSIYADMIFRLQIIHDVYVVSDWPLMLKRMANSESLSFENVEKWITEHPKQ